MMCLLLRADCVECSVKQVMTAPALKTILTNWRGYREEL